jgi:hypothetical protein
MESIEIILISSYISRAKNSTFLKTSKHMMFGSLDVSWTWIGQLVSKLQEKLYHFKLAWVFIYQ